MDVAIGPRWAKYRTIWWRALAVILTRLRLLSNSSGLAVTNPAASRAAIHRSAVVGGEQDESHVSFFEAALRLRSHIKRKSKMSQAGSENRLGPNTESLLRRLSYSSVAEARRWALSRSVILRSMLKTPLDGRNSSFLFEFRRLPQSAKSSGDSISR